jgi:enoyl-CoA hydratase/carnithine racemase
MDETAEAWVELDRDPQVRVIVNSGMGRGFNTGADVKEIATDEQGMKRYSSRLKNFELRLTGWHCEVQKPVICAVNGICAGGGLHYVADADIVIAASNATFMDPHASVGQVVAYEAIGLVRRMPFESVMRMALVGKYERLSAQRAYELGMISQIVDPPENLFDEAQALAEKIAKNSPTAMIASKKALWGAQEAGLTAAMKAGGVHLWSMWDHPDQLEGPKAFAEKREAHWVEPEID